jgi:hypothetical protein
MTKSSNTEMVRAARESYDNFFFKCAATVAYEDWERVWFKATKWALDQQPDSTSPVMNAPGYQTLASVLQRAYDQAARGKGKERHANGKPFHLQPMQDLIRLHGIGFATGQASKKASEGPGLVGIDRQVAELLGAIVYLAGAVIALEAADVETVVTAVEPDPVVDARAQAFEGWGGGFGYPDDVYAYTQVEVQCVGDTGFKTRTGPAQNFSWTPDAPNRVNAWRHA